MPDLEYRIVTEVMPLTYLKIEDVAKTLNLDYKTCYKLVLSGQIPAAKIGAQYRISQADLDQFLNSRRTCVGSTAAVESAGEVACCARCGVAFRVPSMVAGKCASPDCDAPLCNDCWERAGDRFCADHAQPEERVKAIEEARERRRRGEIPVFITPDRARQRELTFISRFDQSVRKLTGVDSPWDRGWTPVRDWASLCCEEPGLLPRGAATIVKYGRGRRVLPRNATSFYYLGATGSKKKPFALAASSFSRVEAYQNQGFDTARAGRETLLEILENAVDLTVNRGTRLVLGVASPTGWDAEAEEAVVGSVTERGFSHADIVLVLVDLDRNSFKFNPADSRAGRVLDLFIGELEEETLARVTEAVRHELFLRDSLTLTDAVKAAGETEHLVLKCFSRLQSEGGYTVDWIKGLGSVISKKL